MDERIKAAWVAELRSGKWKQVKSQLRHGQRGRCCLGVLCDLAEAEGIVQKARFRDCGRRVNGYVAAGDLSDKAAHVLPYAVSSWAGLWGPNPTAGGNLLAYLNDTGASFVEIADIIERES